MLKRITGLLIFLAVLFLGMSSSISTYAGDIVPSMKFTQNGISYEVTRTSADGSWGYVKITGNELKDIGTELDISAMVTYEHHDYYIEEISDRAFAFATMETIKLPLTLKRIGACAFYGCKNLKAFEISGTVTYIGEGAFSFCESLENLTVEWNSLQYRMKNNVLYTYDLKTLVSGVAATGEVTLNKKCENVSAYAFEGNSRVTSVAGKSGLKTIGADAFYCCRNLESIVIPSSVSSIEGNPFICCNKLTNITVGAKNKHYKQVDGMILSKSGKTLYSCPSASGKVTLPETVKYIDEYAFSGNEVITSIVIPSRIRNVREGAFCDCTSLANVRLESASTAIGEEDSCYIFYNTPYNLNVYIPKGLTESKADTLKEKIRSNAPEGVIIITK